MKLLGYVVAAIGSASLVSDANANFCSKILESRAFNITSSETRMWVHHNIRNEMCSVEWSNIQQFNDVARRKGISLSTAKFGFGLNSGRARSSGFVKQQRSAICTLNDSQFERQINSNSYTQSTDVAVSAWRDCVKSFLESHQEGLFATLRDGPSRQYFDISFDYRTRGSNKLQIQAFQKDTPTTTTICKNGDVEVTLPFHSDANSVTFRCYKTRAEKILISVNSNAGDVKGLISEGIDATPTELETLQKRLIALESRVTASELELSKRPRIIAHGKYGCPPINGRLSDALQSVCSHTVTFADQRSPESYTVLLSLTQYEQAKGAGFPAYYLHTRNRTNRSVEIHLSSAYNPVNYVRFDYLIVARD